MNDNNYKELPVGWEISGFCDTCKQPYGWPCSVREDFIRANIALSKSKPITKSRKSRYSFGEIFEEHLIVLYSCRFYRDSTRKPGERIG